MQFQKVKKDVTKFNVKVHVCTVFQCGKCKTSSQFLQFLCNKYSIDCLLTSFQITSPVYLYKAIASGSVNIGE